jgi:DnaJ-domain-containing protein 1
MSMAAFESVIGLFRDPSRVEDMRNRALPEGLSAVIRIAAGDEELAGEWSSETGESAEAVTEACVFFLQQVLFAPGSDSYRVLGAAPDATQAKLREHYGLLMRWLHPDRQGEDGWESIYADRVNQAWQDLKTPKRRAEYDAQPREAGSPAMSGFSSVSLQRMPAAVSRPVPRGPVLSGSVVQRLPAITLGILGVSALATVALVYWSRQNDDKFLVTRAQTPVAAAAPAAAATPDGADDAAGTPAEVPAQVAASAAPVRVLDTASDAITDAATAAPASTTHAVADAEPPPEERATASPAGMPAPAVDGKDSALAVSADESAITEVATATNALAFRLGPDPIAVSIDPPAPSTESWVADLAPVLVAGEASGESTASPQEPSDAGDGRGDPVSSAVPVVSVASAGSPEPAAAAASAPSPEPARVASRAQASVTSEPAAAETSSGSSLSMAAATAPAASVRPAPEVRAPRPRAGAEPAATPPREAPATAMAAAAPTRPAPPAQSTPSAAPAPETRSPVLAAAEAQAAPRVAAADAPGRVRAADATPPEPRVAGKPEPAVAPAAPSVAVAAVAADPVPVPAPVAPTVSAEVAAGLIQDLAAAYAAGDVGRFDKLLRPGSGREALSLRQHLLASDMRFLELTPGAWRSSDGLTSSEVRFRLTVLPKGERKAQTETGTLAVDVAMVDGEARITRFDWPPAGRP